VNFALPAVTLLLLLLPGILAVQGFLGRIGRKSSDPVGQSGLTWAMVLALLIAPILHLVWLTIVSAASAGEPDVRAMIALLAGRTDDDSDFDAAVKALATLPWHVALYFLSVSLFGLVLGWLVRWFVRSFELDRRFSLFRFASDWHYLFTGELRSDLPTPDFVVVTATVDHSGKSYLYLGVLQNYAFDRDGELLRLHLATAMRRPLEGDRKPGEEQQMPDKSGRWYTITGDELVLNMRDVATLNVRYMYVTDVSEPTSTETGELTHAQAKAETLE
jgi:hypothetical protein